jgi:chromosomal replication initiator protein
VKNHFTRAEVNPIVNYGDHRRFSTDNNGLNPKFRLSNYVVGSNNDLAVSAAQAVIENPGLRYNPYFIYGGPGLGKTHLIQAIGNEILERNPDMRVLYVTIEQFYHEFVEAMRKSYP